MTAVGQAFDGLHDDHGGVRDALRGLRGDATEELRRLRPDFSSVQNRLVQVGFGLVAALTGAAIAVIVALA